MKKHVLVTGGNGLVGSHCILQLLEQGYPVKTTVRSLSKVPDVIKMLKNGGGDQFENLTFVEADLCHDENWEAAMQNCEFVLSVASPVFFDTPSNEADAVRPAIDGTLRILQFAKRAGVKRVVMTSNFGAVGFSHTNKGSETTEDDWTDPNLKGLSTYEKSKLLAELAAWDFINRSGDELELTTINPVSILGPSLDAHDTGSFQILVHLLDGSMKAVPNIPLNIVDVRDVADLHIRAMEHHCAKNQRFIATADGQISMQEVAALLISKMGDTKNIPTKKLPSWIIHLASLFNAKAKMASTLMKVNRNVSNKKAKEMLGWTPQPIEHAILASLDSINKYGVIK